MPSREAMQIAEAQWEHALTGTGIVRRDGKVRDLARSIDALRVADLEALLKPVAYTYDGMVFAIRCRIDSIKAAMGETR